MTSEFGLKNLAILKIIFWPFCLSQEMLTKENAKKKKLAQNILFAHFSCLKSFSSQFYISLRKVIIP